MAQNIDNPVEFNPNFDKQYFLREMDRLDFLDHEDMGGSDFMAHFEEMDTIRMYAGDPSTQVKNIKDGT